MADKAPIWDAIVKRHDLVARPIEQVATWGFGDFVWGLEHDVISSVIKLRQAGFHDTIDTEEQILAILQQVEGGITVVDGCRQVGDQRAGVPWVVSSMRRKIQS